MTTPADHAIEGIDHVQITIPERSEQVARSFYCGVLGFVEIAKPDSLIGRGGIWVQAGSVQLHIGTESERDRTQTKAHVAYRVPSLAEWRMRLEQAGCQIEASIQIPGFNRFETRDPFGNRIEFVAVCSVSMET